MLTNKWWMLSALLPVLVACNKVSSNTPKAPANFVAVTFPDSFLWGTANATWQVEGDFAADGVDPVTNWRIWTEMNKIQNDERNPRGAGFYTMYKEDFDRAAALGTNAFRMGIEWARVEPVNDLWNQAAIDHYVTVIKAARARGLQVMLTFWHWSVPDWISDPSKKNYPARDQLGVPDNRWVQDQFAQFVSKVVPYVAPYVDLYSILNEPWSMITGGYVAGVFPPGNFLDIKGAQSLNANLLFMHAKAARIIRKLDTIDADGDGKPALIGIAKAAALALPSDRESQLDINSAKSYTYIFNDTFIDALVTGNPDFNWNGSTHDTDTVPPEHHYDELAGTLDWVGVQYYGPLYIIGGEGDPPFTGLPDPFGGVNSDAGYPYSEMGSQLRPDVYVGTVEHYWDRYKLPIYLTENGIGDCDSNQRPRNLVENLYALGRARAAEGIDIRGYFYWSLTDNFEWAEGTSQCFGLFAVNYDTLKRTRRPGADVYKHIIADGIDYSYFLKGYNFGYDTDQSGRSVTDVINEIEEEVRNGISARRPYRR